MRVRTFLLCLGCALLLALPALSQGIPTGTLSGRVTADNQSLPGVTVTASSPSLQGKRSATTNSNGDYTIPLLPPGDYQVAYEIEGFAPSQRSIKVNAAQNNDLDVALNLAGVAETIEVVGSYETISSSSEAQATYPKEFIESLPMERDVRNTVLLNAGVSDNGPAAAIIIAGAQSYESLFLVNGVVVNENLRGQPLTLFIEDAIEETTTSVSGISAEYGRFAGGVVNTITKSGGNGFSGSFRTNFTNDKWIGTTPATTAERIDNINRRYEGTLGGWLWKDRLWYFLAARQFETDLSAQLLFTQIPYLQHDEELRTEAKLTLSPFEGHRLIGSYIEVDRTNNGNNFLNRAVDVESLDNRELPQELTALNYTGVITDNFFLEGQYSERYFAFEGSGSDFTDRIRGTWIEDGVEVWRYNSPTFCGVCKDEERNNENFLAKASWFLSTGALGSHDIAIGYDTFKDIRISDNFQSGSNYSVFSTTTLFVNNRPVPVFQGDGSTLIVYWPIASSSLGTDFVTNSLYVNDRWRLNDKWSFNIGARYDENDGKNAQGSPVAKDDRISPRLGASFDLKGDGDWVFNFSYGEYVTALANNIGDSTSSAGVPSIFVWLYGGPDVNVSGPLVTTAQALTTLFAWFDASGGPTGNIDDLVQVTIPGGSTVILDGLKSPFAQEISFGVAKRLGNRGLVRADLVDREYSDFYVGRTDLSTGRITTPNGAIADRTILENSSDGRLERTYQGLHTQFQYRFSDRLNLGGVYTLSKTEGNITGETSGAGPVTSAVLAYPEYKQERWNSPSGYLGSDQRHRLRLYGVWDIFKTDRNQLSLGVLQNYSTGTPYGAVGAVNPKFGAATGAGGGCPTCPTNPGYASNATPNNVTYFYTARDAFRTDDITATDLTLNYTFTWNVFNKAIDVFLQPEVLNVFGEEGVIAVNTAVADQTSSGALRRFDPFRDTPVECTATTLAGCNQPGAPVTHWRKGNDFGKATTPGSYQTARTFRFSVGFRF